MSSRKKTNHRHIHAASDGARQFIVHPDDNDIFVRTGQQVIEACRLGIGLEVWLDELKAMRELVSGWIKERAAKISACYIAPRSEGIGLFFVPKSPSFNFDLADELAKLNRRLIQEFRIGMVEIHQVPDDALECFLIPEKTVQVYSDAESPHQSVEA